MDRRTKSAALWGLVGVFAFLALHQAYLLAGGALISIPAVVAIALLVGVSSGTTAYAFEIRLLQYGR